MAILIIVTTNENQGTITDKLVRCSMLGDARFLCIHVLFIPRLDAIHVFYLIIRTKKIPAKPELSCRVNFEKYWTLVTRWQWMPNLSYKSCWESRLVCGYILNGVSSSSMIRAMKYQAMIYDFCCPLGACIDLLLTSVFLYNLHMIWEWMYVSLPNDDYWYRIIMIGPARSCSDTIILIPLTSTVVSKEKYKHHRHDD